MTAPSDVSSLVDDSAVDLVMQMMAIPGKSGQEGKISEFIVKQLHAAGIDDSHITFDTAHKKSPFGGEVGNLIVKLPGTKRAPRRLLMAHIDTVPLCVGCQPYRDGDVIRSKNPKTALGGDDRAGAATVLNTIKLIQKHKLPHPPLTLFFAVQEEVGLIGARYVTVSKLGSPKLCFNWDGGPAGMATIGATGDDHLHIEITGIASHAGAHPEDGVSAIAIAAKAISTLVYDGWFGKVVKGKKTGSSNIGVIQGGDATNVVTDHVLLKGEVRSHDPVFRAKIVDAYRKAFELAVKSIHNAAGDIGSLKFEATHKYESFRMEPDAEVVQAASAAIKQIGLTPELKISNGGLDANWMATHGLPTVTLGCGQSAIHTIEEHLFVDSYLNACRVALLLATE
ncbi:M20/M25/M40 family metallo-hydrolase [Planctomicrobium piriforme]|uniref:Tripeptide aminopeptidase n=1 Tax=Planctomicrobium piriforme TaxID=1576369 RepID=A0A1I3HIR6_9PLAN|nr:M20/M25/M40 family metallo-hydrolase [Planctomicrobium piriforme]SFI35400.1 tripeptide aminopeptidase [Planctomicrobium piriforme]